MDPQSASLPLSDSQANSRLAGTGAGDSVLSARGIVKTFGPVVALDGVDLDLYRGEVLAIIGDNGAGKSTLIKCLVGAEIPDAGEIRVDGKEVRFRTPQDARNAGIETVYQTLSLSPALDIASNLFLGRERVRKGFLGHWLSLLDKAGMRQDAEAKVAALGISTIQDINQFAETLSGGQRQAVSVARAIAFGSKVIVLDEPTAALGVRESSQVLEIVRQLRNRGLGIILISHNIPQVFEIADRIHIQRLGRCAGTITPQTHTMPQAVAIMTGAMSVREHLDLAGVIKASQAISGEIVLEELINTLMRIALEQAGAERGLLILTRGNEQRIEAEAGYRGALLATPGTDPDKVTVQLRQALVNPSELPESLLRYVIRTRESATLYDASTGNLFSEDEYIQRRHPRSVFCLPLIKQGELVGVLYLENNLAPGVFTSNRVATLELIASQAAISLQQARLYAELRRENRDRRKAEEALRASEQRLQDIIDHTPALVTVKDLDLRYLLVNREHERVHAHRGQIRGKTDYDFLPRDLAEIIRANDRLAIETGKPIQFELTIPTAHAERHYVVVKFPLRDAAGKLYAVCGISTDITERKRAEEAWQEAQAELAHVTRLATLGELMTSIAHEINQPLGAIANNAGACVRWLASRNLEKAERSAALVIKDAHRAGEIITRIRSLAKKAPPQKTCVDINETIAEVTAMARDELRRNGVLLRTRLDPDLPRIMADRIQLQQLILNLVINAIEAMSRLTDGPRELSVSSEKVTAMPSPADAGEQMKLGASPADAGLNGNLPERASAMSESLTPNADLSDIPLATSKRACVLVSVADSGPGLDQKDLDHLFDSFYTTKPHGLGMGLAISRSIVEAHGGRLWAKANTPRGALFQFALPGLEPDDQVPAPRSTRT
jgi:PAS domain S-box-containing protein